MLRRVVTILLVIVILGTALPVMWPLFVATDTDIQAMTETDDATTMLQAIWPIGLLVLGLAIVAGIIFYALRKFKVAG